MTDEQLARTIAQADFIWDIGEQGVMACSPDLAGKMFDEAWTDAKSSTRQKFLHIAQAVLALSSTTGQEWREPEGWQLVPKEPTNEMVGAVFGIPIGRRLYRGDIHPDNEVIDLETSKSVYRKMLAAAPLPAPPVAGPSS